MPRKVARTKAFRVVYDPISLEFSLPQTVTVDQLKKQVSMLTGLDTNNFELNGLPSDATGEVIVLFLI